MKFYGNGSVYYPVKKTFVRFENGESIIDDKDIIAFLVDGGYKHDEEEKEVGEKEELLEKAKSLGIDAKGTWGVNRLKTEIEKVENERN